MKITDKIELYNHDWFMKKLELQMFDRSNKKCLFIGGFDFKSKNDFKQWIEDNNLLNIKSLIGLEIELTDYACNIINLKK